MLPFDCNDAEILDLDSDLFCELLEDVITKGSPNTLHI